MATRRSTQSIRTEIAALYSQRGTLMADLLTRLAFARGMTDLQDIDEKTREHLTFEVVQLVANWDGARGVDRAVTAEDEVGTTLAAIVDLEDSISVLEDDLPEA